MTFISYAQNLEDVILWRALKDVDGGFYIDAGAAWPEIDSVTKSFYDRGWRGINIEPNPSFQKKLRHERPRDINVEKALGDREGTPQIYILENTGLSTMDATIAKKHRNIAHTEPLTVQVTTLNQVWKEHVPQGQAVHFLKLDIEGLEEQVIREFNWEQHRPWIVVVEATEPMSHTPAHKSWEKVLIEKNYLLVYNDGLNRFYLAQEHKGLAPRFQHPPNVFDEYVLNREQEARMRAESLEIEVEYIKRRLRELDEEYWNRHHECCDLKRKLNQVYDSFSWTITWPLRKSFKAIKKFHTKYLHHDKTPQKKQALTSSERKPQLFVDVSELVKLDSKSGIQRVTRNILREWLTTPPDGVSVEPVYGNDRGETYYYARAFTAEFLDNSHEKKAEDTPIQYQAGDIFLGLDLQPEIIPKNEGFYQTLRQSGVTVKFVVYDLLPIFSPEYFPGTAYSNHKRWLETIIQNDGALCISQAVARELVDWLKIRGIDPAKNAFEVDSFQLGGNMESTATEGSLSQSVEELFNSVTEKPSFVSVGTLEPRKGHLQIVKSFEVLWAEGMDLVCILVGKEGWLTDDLVPRIQHHPELGKRLFWIKEASDRDIQELYQQSTCLIMASFGEGFGLPIIEAAKYHLPIIARDIPVFREVAGNHATYFKGRTRECLATTIKHWLKLYQRNEHPKTDTMPWLTWKQSAVILLKKVLPNE